MSELWKPNFARGEVFSLEQKHGFDNFVHLAIRFPANILAQGVGIAHKDRLIGDKFIGLDNIIKSPRLVQQLVIIGDTMHRGIPDMPPLTDVAMRSILNTVTFVAGNAFLASPGDLQSLLEDTNFTAPIDSKHEGLLKTYLLLRVINRPEASQLLRIFN